VWPSAFASFLLLGLFQFVEVCVEQVVGDGDVLVVPAFPLALFVAGDEHDPCSLRVEGEQCA
jgi:hypothetical protein